MDLTFDDLLVLGRASLAQQSIVTTSALEESSLPRLVKADLATDQGKLTKKGVKAAEKVKPLIEAMYSGVPLEKRLRNEAKEAERHDSSTVGWFTGMFKQKPYFTNTEILLYGKPAKSMRATLGNSNTRQAVANTLISFTSGKPQDFVQLHQKLFLLDRHSDIRCIKLESESGLEVLIQAKYYDLIKEKFPSATFHINVKRLETEKNHVPVQVRVTNRGWSNNTMGLVLRVIISASSDE